MSKMRSAIRGSSSKTRKFPFHFPSINSMLQLNKLPVVKPITEAVTTSLIKCCPSENEMSSTLYTCAYCLGIPRFPAKLSTCDHVACVQCLKDNLLFSGNTLSDVNGVRSAWKYASCAVCRAQYSLGNVVMFENWSLLERAAFRMIVVDCPNIGCFFSGNITELIAHEKFKCSKRQIECPCMYCDFVGSEDEIRSHIHTCEDRRVLCVSCNFPVRKLDLNRHDCYATMRTAIEGKSRSLVRLLLSF